MLNLGEEDLANLRESGLTDDTILANRLYTETGAACLAALLNRSSGPWCRGGGLVIPYRGLDGTIDGFARVRPRTPRRESDGSPIKYEQPVGMPVRAYFPAESLDALRNGYGRLLLTEGEKKALALAQAGYAALGLGGVYGWKVKDVEELIPDLAGVPWSARSVYVVYDYDPKPSTRRNVDHARRRLADLLRKAGSRKVYAVELPPGPNGVKQGVDDYLVAHSFAEFEALVTQARPIPPVRAETPGSQRPQSTQTAADTLVRLVTERGVELWHDSDGETGYATVRAGGGTDNHDVRSKAFRSWLSREYFRATGKAASTHAIQDALSVIEAQARHDGLCHPVFVRVGEHGGRIYIDLADDERRVVEIHRDGWGIVTAPPVRFLRPKGMAPLPTPERGGNINVLRRFVNVAEEHWPIVLAWLVAALRPRGPFPILKLLGEQGGGKSTFARVCRMLVDPNVAPLRSLPRGERDLMISAMHNWVVCLDNLSYINPDSSDILCRLSTGSAMATRTLYADAEVTIFQAQRPVILNGIEGVGFRGDLLDRCLVVELPPITQDRRRPEDEFWGEFRTSAPQLLGALVGAVAAAIRNLPRVRAAKYPWPRMADFAEWAEAAEGSLGLPEGAFRRAYEANRADTGRAVLEGSLVASAILQFLNKQARFVGTAEQLLSKLEIGRDTRQKGWPGNARALASQLARLAPNLRQTGVEIEQSREKNTKLWRLARGANTPQSGGSASASTQSTGTSGAAIPSVPLSGGKRPEETLGQYRERLRSSGSGGKKVDLRTLRTCGPRMTQPGQSRSDAAGNPAEDLHRHTDAPQDEADSPVGDPGQRSIAEKLRTLMAKRKT